MCILNRLSQRPGNAGNYSAFSKASDTGPTALGRTLTFYTHYLAQGVYDFYQVFLCRHDGLDILVGAGCFIQHRVVLAALDMGSGFAMVVQAEGFFRLVATHDAPGTMTAGVEAVGIAQSAHDKAFCAHGTGNDAQLPAPGRHCTLARDPDLLAKVFFLLDVVVVAVD